MASIRLVLSHAVLAAIVVGGQTTEAEHLAPSDREATEQQQQQQGPTAEQLQAWHDGLDAPRYAEREQATDALLSAGPAAVPYLKSAAHGDSLEAADRAVWVLQQLAATNDELVQIAVLEVLVAADRFPAVAREAEGTLAELNVKRCQHRLEALGAEFIPKTDVLDRGAAPRITSIKVNTNREEWTGGLDDLMLLAKLRRIGKLTIASRLLDDETVGRLAAIDGLYALVLIETKVSLQKAQQLRVDAPELQVVLHQKTKLGVKFYPGQPLDVTEVLPNSPAHRAGLKTDDRVTVFAGKPVHTFDGLTALIAQHEPGNEVEIVVERQGEKRTLTATLGGTDWWEELKDD